MMENFSYKIYHIKTTIGKEHYQIDIQIYREIFIKYIIIVLFIYN